MGNYLNPDAAVYRQIANSPLYIDKSNLIGFLNGIINGLNKYVCVTMPSRFGKTFLAEMVTSYYTKGDDARDVFSKLDASKDPAFEKHLNKHNVIKLDIATLCAREGLKEVEPKIVSRVGRELADAYPKVDFSRCEGFAEEIIAVSKATGERFVIVIDEWDYLLRSYPGEPEVADRYIGFLRSLFKNADALRAIELCYMTGIMPIKRYRSMSALNEFKEYTMLEPMALAPCFGFSEAEVRKVMEQSNTKLTMEELREWYDGYRLEGIGEVYCPSSVVNACQNGKCLDYFAGSAAVSAITMGLKNNFISLEKEAAILLAGGSVSVNPGDFSSDLSRLDTPNKGLTALIHAGFLRYETLTGEASIPNREVALRFNVAIRDIGFEGGVSDLAETSRAILTATLKSDEAYVAKAFDDFHQRFVSLFDKTNEAALSVLASVAYSEATRFYLALKEPNLGLGRADIAFLPLKKGEKPALVIELKVNDSADSAIEQIKAKKYYKPLEGYYGEVLLVGISFDKDTLKHTCRIERIIKEQ